MKISEYKEAVTKSLGEPVQIKLDHAILPERDYEQDFDSGFLSVIVNHHPLVSVVFNHGIRKITVNGIMETKEGLGYTFISAFDKENIDPDKVARYIKVAVMEKKLSRNEREERTRI